MPGPAYHARTHLPGGTDPIPVQKAWAYVGAGSTGQTFAAGTSTFVEFDGAGTNNPDVYATGLVASETIRNQPGDDTLWLLAPGQYVILADVQFTAPAPAGAVLRMWPDAYGSMLGPIPNTVPGNSSFGFVGMSPSFLTTPHYNYSARIQVDLAAAGSGLTLFAAHIRAIRIPDDPDSIISLY